MERDIWILLQSVAPRQAALWIADKLDAMGDLEFRALNLECDRASEWSADDPRLAALAARTARWLGHRHAQGKGIGMLIEDPAVTSQVATSAGASSPAWDRLTRLASEHRAGS